MQLSYRYFTIQQTESSFNMKWKKGPNNRGQTTVSDKPTNKKTWSAPYCCFDMPTTLLILRPSIRSACESDRSSCSIRARTKPAMDSMEMTSA